MDGFKQIKLEGVQRVLVLRLKRFKVVIENGVVVERQKLDPEVRPFLRATVALHYVSIVSSDTHTCIPYSASLYPMLGPCQWRQ